MKKKIPKRILTVILSLAVILSLLPAVSAVAADDGSETETTTSGIELSKTATLEDNGTYTINLEAYATGETTTTSTESSVPLDIVLVIDQSGSMANNISSTTYTALDSTGYTYNSYGSNSYYYLAEDGNYYKVSRGDGNSLAWLYGDHEYYLKYTDSSNTTHYLSGTGTTTTQPKDVSSNTATIWTGILYTATTTTTTKLTALKTAVTSFVNAISENATETGADHRIAIVGFASSGSQYNQTAWEDTGLFVNGSLVKYNNIKEQNYTDALVSVNTDGSVTTSITTAISNIAAYGGTYTQYGVEMANNVFDNNSATYTKEDGTEGTRQRIMVVFTDGEPGSNGYTESEAGAAVNNAYITKNTYSATVYTIGLYSSASDNVTNFMNYLSANYPSAQYSNNSWSAGTQASSKYYMTTNDATELNNIFQTISSEATSSSTSVTLDANSVMKDIMGDGFTLTDDSTVTIKTVAGTSDGTTVTWGDETTNSASYTISDDKTTVSVTGFDYADKYISSGHAGEKICVTITGVLPTTDVTTDEAVNTNAATSGIYATVDATEATATFEQPQTIITKKLYVLDYGKEVTLDSLDQSSVTGIVSTYSSVSSSDNALKQTYGKSSLTNNVLTYTPTTTNWDGYDSLYVFGQTSNETIKSYSANSNGNLWSKVSVIPASNVYYEDDFVTNESDGIVGITYSGTWTTASGDTSSASTSQSSENILYGTDVSYADDTTYTDGSAQKGESGATATFTFTGTGVDIYSSTDNDACIVYVYLYDADENLKQYAVANNYAANGKYYVVPTVTFENLNYDTYTVKLRVVKNNTNNNAVNYYLDGIRVYNPLETVSNDKNDAGTAYAAAKELNAKYTEIRSMLLNSTADVDGEGMLFIDDIDSTDNKDGEDTDDIIGTYESVGPEHEVYLSKGNGVAFTLKNFGNGDAVYVGIKSAQGYTGTVEVTNGNGDKAELKITSTADQYYKITPDSNGNVVIVNTGEAVVSLTKVRTTSPDTNDISFVSNETTVTAISSFSLLSSSSYTDEPITDVEAEAGGDEDAAIDTETEDDTTGDVVIETETPEQGSSTGSASQSTFSSIFNKIIGWMSGRR